MNKLSDEKREEKYQGYKEKLEKLSSRNEELTTLITKLYEDHALGKIPVKHFDRAIKIENLTFSYYGYVKPIFENVSFSFIVAQLSRQKF